ncbi:hypothetical protein [uncultured Faecalibaculum sp.]|uniref:hypothetical protein n=1 Tax=uncultured Faecalibaculum sp. TaxID=1729681 RepID=UPI0025E9BE67|nr:hypothetical protein [uncultured Faecalibaculum sp.]
MTKRTTDIALDLSDSESQALYDDHAKRLLGYRWILAAFLRESLPEVARYTTAQIVEMTDPDFHHQTASGSAGPGTEHGIQGCAG